MAVGRLKPNPAAGHLKGRGIWDWPTTTVIDKKGIVRHSHIGGDGYDRTASLIKQLLVEKSYPSIV
jgi:hypothetical protein